jgi:hypothetical protein
MSNPTAGHAKENHDEQQTQTQTQTQMEVKVKFGKNHSSHKRRAAKRIAEREASQKYEAARQYTRNPQSRNSPPRPPPQPRQDLENLENHENRFVWYANPTTANQNIHLTMDMFPPLQ